MSRANAELPQYSRRLDSALALVADAFRCKVRKASEIPYLTHLLQVMVIVAENDGSEDQMIAALLHDYLEDIEGATYEEVEERFGEGVARMVRALSDTENPKEKAPWESRKAAYLERLAREPPEVKLVSSADKLHNARSIRRDMKHLGDAVWDRFTGKKECSLWYYREIVKALGQNWAHPLLEELRTEVELLNEEAGRVQSD